MEFLDQFKPIIEWLNLHPGWAGVVAFLISLSESLAVIGLLIPGSVMMTALGTLVGAGIIPAWEIIIAAILGAIVGDGLSYRLGYHFKEHILEMWPFKRYPALIEKGKQFFTDHGGKSVFLGRFGGPMRPVVPMVAGMLHMNSRRFFISNVISAIIWAPVYMVPGILIGMATLELEPAMATRFIITVLIILLCIGLSAWLIKRIIEWIIIYFDNLLTRLWQMFKRHPKLKFFCKALQDPKHPDGHGQLTMGFAFLLCLLAFILLTIYVHVFGGFAELNQMVLSYFSSYRLHNPAGPGIIVTLFGEKKIILIVAAINIAFLAHKGYWRAALHFALGIFIYGVVVYSLKNLTYTPRPNLLLTPIMSGSYPSGHTTLTIVFYGILSMLICRNLKPFAYRWIYTLTAFLCICVGISRLYLAAHWCTDVMGGMLLGLTIVFGINISYHRILSPALNGFKLLWCNLAGIFIVILLCFIIFHHHYNEKYQTKPLQHQVSIQDWWQGKLPGAPLYRLDRAGKPISLLNLQWADDLKNIQHFLLKNQWTIVSDKDIFDIVLRLSSQSDKPQLPVLQELNWGESPSLVAFKQDSQSRFLVIINLYQPNYYFSDSHLHLWLGTIEYRMPRRHKFWLHKKHEKKLNELPPPIHELIPELRHYHWKRIVYKNVKTDGDGSVLLITH